MNRQLQEISQLDRMIHEPARLMIMMILNGVGEADFLYLLKATELTRGNLSSHLSRLEEADYVAIEKGFVGKTPRTVCRLTDEGADALDAYRNQLRKIV